MSTRAEDHVLAIDAGTGSCRAVLFAADGRQVAIAAREWSHPEVPGVPGAQDFSAAANWQLISSCIRTVLSTPGVTARSVRAVAATSMREGIVLYDEDGAEIWACPNADARAGAQASRLVANGAAQRIYDQAGDWVAITSPARLLWLRENEPALFAAVRHLGMLSDWITYRLCGEFVTEPTAGSSSGMFDLTQRTWSPQIVALTGLPAEVLPPVLPPGTVAGQVTAAAAAATGLAEGTPVMTAGADTQLGLHALGATPGCLTIVGGSFWQHTAVMTAPLVDPQARLRTLCHVGAGQWMIEGIGFYTGLSLRWFRDAFCADLVAKARSAGENAYALIERAACAVPPGAHGVLAVAGNIMRASSWTHAAPSFLQFDLTRRETGRDACARALLESAAYVSRAHADILREVTGMPGGTVLLGGGASGGTLWPQILADVLGQPVRTAPVTEATALGAAMIAAPAAGLGRLGGAGAGSGAGPGGEFLPDAVRCRVYDELYERWIAVNAAMNELTDRMDLRPLWRAPGTSPSNTPAGGSSA
jgi:autoinducer 2 (AI-2) kinase